MLMAVRSDHTRPVLRVQVRRQFSVPSRYFRNKGGRKHHTSNTPQSRLLNIEDEEEAEASFSPSYSS